MATCFVIQPFDRGPYDKRYDDIIAPAVSDAGLEPYRVDRDPKVVIPIDEIEAGIRQSLVCLADVTADNPNVWYELGFAFASAKPVVLIAREDPGRRFPFDIQHRHIIQYRTDSARDFETLRQEISSRLQHAIERASKMSQLSQSPTTSRLGGLTPHEVAALVALGERTESERHFISGGIIRGEMENAGFTRIATRISLQTLETKGLIVGREFGEDDGGSETYYTVTGKGAQWFLDHEDVLTLRTPAA